MGQPYMALLEHAEKKGWTIGTFDRVPIETADRVLAFNYLPFPVAMEDSLQKVGPENITAVIQEPPGQVPLYYDHRLLNGLGLTFLPCSAYTDKDQCRYLGFPVPIVRVRKVPFAERKLLASITSGKVTQFAGSLYDERIQAIKFFEASVPQQFDMFGQKWTRFGGRKPFSPDRRFQSYRGECSSKFETLAKYRFCLCYENTSKETGYITEKMLDCFLAGCVPIYLGAPDILDHIPSACFVDRRKFETYEALLEYLSQISEAEFQGFLSAINDFKLTTVWKEREPAYFAENLLRHVVSERKKVDAAAVRDADKILTACADLQRFANKTGIISAARALKSLSRLKRHSIWNILLPYIRGIQHRTGLDVVSMHRSISLATKRYPQKNHQVI